MKSYAEFSVLEKYAQEFLPFDLGKNLNDTVRKIQVPLNSDIYTRIGELDSLVRARDDNFFFAGWNIVRKYSKKELYSSELLLLKIKRTFEPTGIECGTIYDKSNVCDLCGSGLIQTSDLILDLNSVPRNVDIAKTLSDEIIVSQRFANLITDNNITGCRLGGVHHKHYFPRDTIDSINTEAGRELDRKAQQAGYPRPTWQFYVWLNKPEQKELVEKAFSETQAYQKPARYKREPWYQLMTTSQVTVNSATITGIHPFDEDVKNEYRCKYGHTMGLNILSELALNKNSWNGSGISATKELFGVNRGLLRTSPGLVISQRLYRIMVQENVKGFSVEVVHLLE